MIVTIKRNKSSYLYRDQGDMYKILRLHMCSGSSKSMYGIAYICSGLSIYVRDLACAGLRQSNYARDCE